MKLQAPLGSLLPILHGRSISAGIVIALILTIMSSIAGPLNDASPRASDPMLLHLSDTLSVRGHLRTGVNVVAEQNLFWDLASRATGNNTFDADAEWVEVFIEPGVSFEKRLDADSTFFGKVSTVASYTGDTDAFDATDTGRVTLEEGFLGYRTEFDNGWEIETSGGAQKLRLGTGMLIANGGGDGFERGALKFGPREAWEMTGLLKASRGPLSATGFFLDANEMDSNDQMNELAGADLRWDGENGDCIGVSYINVVHSEAVYPQASVGGIGPPNFVVGGREGLQSLNYYGHTHPFEGPLENLAFALDFAHQWSNDIDLQAYGGRAKVEYTFEDAPWRPVLSYYFQHFSGDDPNTGRLERFDPLYYDGSPSAWATGSKSAMVFINSNVQSHNVSYRVNPTERDIVTLRYAHVRVDELRSPVQFGQATRLSFSGGTSTVVSGVTDAHLSDDFFLEYTRIINPNTFLTGGFSISVPGEGIKAAAGGTAPDWTGFFLNVVINY